MPRHALNVATRVPDRTAAAAAVMEWELQTAREAKPLTPPLAVKARQQQQQEEEEEVVVVVVVRRKSLRWEVRTSGPSDR